MDPTHAFAQLQLGWVDPIPWRYEVSRPLGLFGAGTAAPRAQDTQRHPDTVRTLARRFRQHGIPGLCPGQGPARRPGRASRIPEEVRQEVDRLKTLYGGVHYRALARIFSWQLPPPIHDKPAKQLWQRSAGGPQAQRPLETYPPPADRAQARLQGIELCAQGWAKRSMSHFRPVSRPTIDRWLQRFEAEHRAGLHDKSHAPKVPARKVWLPLMRHVYDLQKAHPDAGELRIWSLLARPALAVRTVGRIMARNKRLYPDIPPVHPHTVQGLAQPHPYKATRRHQYWCIDGRQMDCTLEDGVKWWSILGLEGYARVMRAGISAPEEATGPRCWCSSGPASAMASRNLDLRQRRRVHLPRVRSRL